MNKALRNLIISSALGSMAFAGFSCSAMASTQRMQDKAAISQLATTNKYSASKHHMRSLRVIQLRRARSPWHLGLKLNRHFDENQARTITTAALLMSGHTHMSVGKISPMPGKRAKRAYLVQIDNKKNKVVKDLIFNRANGHIRPL